MTFDPEMTISVQADVVKRNVNSIFHPSDFSKASEVAFAHALKFALIAESDLNILHVTKDVEDVDWSEFPGIRDTLIRWGLISEGTERHDVANLGIKVRKLVGDKAGPVTSCLKFLEKKPADIIVLATQQRDGRMRWFQSSVSEPIARKSGGAATLFVPHGVDGFISLKDGAVSLNRILIPVDRSPDPAGAVTVAARLTTVLKCKEDVQFTLLYVGDRNDTPVINPPGKEGWNWNAVAKKGDVVETILETAGETAADVIVMSTAGHDGFIDALRGSTTERVMRGAKCPLIAIPEERHVPPERA